MFDSLRALAVFERVATLGSFRAAARALGLSPSVVSHHVKALEERLSLPLLHRSTRRIALTPDGETLLVSAREMVSAAERGLDRATGNAGAPTGTLRLTAPAFLAQTALLTDVAAFTRAYPRVSLSIGFTDAPRDLLRDQLDLAIRIGRLEDSALVARKLATMRRALVASPSYVRARKRPRLPRDLLSWELIQLASRPPELALSAPGKRAVKLTLAPRLTVDSAAAMLGLVRGGAGLATVPEVLVRHDLAHGELIEVLPAWSLASMSVYAVWPGHSQRATLTERFVAELAPRIAALFDGSS